ncbi:Uma2 family endonuclease [Kitasatospora acidiphila]|uniref:Uma2 family endonuclease n=1 Tax=Kitasatospora acidiphila TaxID=2567942 RepID=UPI001E494FA7|nr:Uma2 family endonuclease [Kitasatospora acidiphila]
MRPLITAEQYDSWSEEVCADIEVSDGLLVRRPSRSHMHNRLARFLANALETAAGPEWYADGNFDVRLQDVPLTNRCPDVVLYRASTIDVMPARPEHILLLVEVVSPGPETTDRITKPAQYAKAGIQYYWRVEQFSNADPKVFTYELDPKTATYRASEAFTGLVKATAPFKVTADLTGL